MNEKDIEIIEKPKQIENLKVPEWYFLDSQIDYQKLLEYQNKNNMAFMQTFGKLVEAVNELKAKE